MDTISAKTRLYGVIGFPVGHSLSPAIHNAALAALGLDARYLACPVAPGRLGEALTGARALGLLGLNVTVPHKEEALTWARGDGASVSPAAAAIGAINTIAFSADGKVRVENTDAAGFLRSLREAGFEPAGRRVALLGAGGAARAAAWALTGAGARVTVLNRTAARADALVADLTATTRLPGSLATHAWDDATDAIAGAELIVNTTPVGMAPEVEAVPLDLTGLARPGQVVFDIIYRPAETALLRLAREAGAATVNGLGMLVYQAAAAFEFWTGRQAPVEVMWRAARAQLGGAG